MKIERRDCGERRDFLAHLITAPIGVVIYLQCKYVEVEMLRKVFRTGNSVVVSLPREVLEYLDIREGAEIEVSIDRENHQNWKALRCAARRGSAL